MCQRYDIPSNACLRHARNGWGSFSGTRVAEREGMSYRASIPDYSLPSSKALMCPDYSAISRLSPYRPTLRLHLLFPQPEAFGFQRWLFRASGLMKITHIRSYPQIPFLWSFIKHHQQNKCRTMTSCFICSVWFHLQFSSKTVEWAGKMVAQVKKFCCRAS